MTALKEMNLAAAGLAHKPAIHSISFAVSHI